MAPDGLILRSGQPAEETIPFETLRVQRGVRPGSLFLGLFILFPFLLGLALWWKSDAIAEWAVDRISHTSDHEAEHVLQRHSLKGMVHQLGWRVVLSLLFGEGGGQIGRAAAELQVLSFGRDQESEADLKGLTLLKEAKIDPKGMITFFDRLSKKEGASIALLSTHPASAERRSTGSVPGRARRIPYDWDAIKKGLKR